MQSIRMAASAAMTLLLLGFSGLLFGPSFDMPTAGTSIGLGRGALPQFCVLAATVLSIAVFARDLIAYRRTGSITGPVGLSETADPRRVITIGFASLVLLVAFVFGWQWLGFLPAAITFVAITGLLLLPRERWQLPAITLVLGTSVLFGLTVWALFVYVLQVPLR
jgi:hypothetical protein